MEQIDVSFQWGYFFHELLHGIDRWQTDVYISHVFIHPFLIVVNIRKEDYNINNRTRQYRALKQLQGLRGRNVVLFRDFAMVKTSRIFLAGTKH